MNVIPGVKYIAYDNLILSFIWYEMSTKLKCFYFIANQNINLKDSFFYLLILLYVLFSLFNLCTYLVG